MSYTAIHGTRQIQAATITNASQNFGTPATSTDVATKGYVDSVAQGLSVKPSAAAATAVALSPTNTYSTGVLTATGVGILTVDGYNTVLNDYILVKNEASGLKNGLYKVTTQGTAGVAYVLTRVGEMNTSSQFNGAFVFVEQGTTNVASGWVCTNINPSLGSTAIAFTQFSGAGELVAGNGININGNTISAAGVSGQISVGAGGIGIDATYTGQTSITTLGTIGTGTWSATTIAVNKGGTGSTTSTGTAASGVVLATSPTITNLTLAAGTVSLAPLVLTSGTNLSTTKGGAIEYDGSHLYFTAVNSGSRYQLDQQTGTNTGSGTTNYMTKWTGTNVLGNSLIQDSGSQLTVSTTTANWNNYNFISNTLTATSIQSSSVMGFMINSATIQGASNGSAFVGIYQNFTDSRTAGTLPQAFSYVSFIQEISTGATITLSAGFISELNLPTGTGTVTSHYHFYAQPAQMGGGSVGTAIGLYVDTQKETGVTTGYGIYQVGTSDLNTLLGKTGAGVAASTTQWLTIGAGTTTIAPLVLTSGTNLTTTVGGAIEYNGTHLYFTAVNSGTRYQLDQQLNGLTITATTGTFTLTNAKTLSVTNTLTFSGTDSTTMTFPSTSATIARTDAGNTFTGHQTIEGVTSTGATGSGKFVFDTSPTASNVTLAAGTASLAPLVLTSGTNLSTTKAGALEFDGSHLYFTIANSGTRYQLDQQSSTAYTRATTVSGTQDGTNKTFTIANAVSTGSEQVYLNGMLLNPGSSNDYVISSTTITLQAAITAPASTDILRCYGVY